jgi:hypothetical protein
MNHREARRLSRKWDAYFWGWPEWKTVGYMAIYFLVGAVLLAVDNPFMGIAVLVMYAVAVFALASRKRYYVCPNCGYVAKPEEALLGRPRAARRTGKRRRK